MSIVHRLALGFGAAAWLTGCASVAERDSGAPAVQIPDSWSAEQAPSAPVEPWLDDFDDTALAALAREAVGANFELAANTARFDAAMARAVIAGADRLPVIAAAIDATRSKRALDAGRDGLARRRTTFTAELDISWEADVWGRLGNLARAAAIDVDVSQSDYSAARLSLAANVARVWFDAAENTLQLRLAERTVASFQSTLDVIEDRFRLGLNSALDVRLARANVAVAVSQREAEQANLDAARRRLEVLLGRYPAGVLETRADLPVINRTVPAGLPSELLTRRPDLLAAERRLAAADERASAAAKNRLPQLVLTGAGGAGSSDVTDLLDTGALLWRLAAGVTVPVFEGGRLRAQSELADADSREALALYAQALLRALSEVETALSAERYLAGQEQALAEAAQESVLAEELALEQYRAGLVEIITLLESQRRSFDAQQALIRTRNRRLQNRVDLYLALGGDFDAAGGVAAAATAIGQTARAGADAGQGL